MADEVKPPEGAGDNEPHGEDKEPDYKALYEAEKAHSRKWEKQAKANRSAADELEKAREAGKTAEEQIADLTKRLDEKEKAEQRAKVAAKVAEKKGVPVELIVGDDEESMEAFADKMLTHFKKKPAAKVDKPGQFDHGEGKDNSGLRGFTRQLLGKEKEAEMANDTTKVTLPREAVTTVINKVKDTSTIAALSPSEPQKFDDKTYLVFNPTSEAEVVAEGAKKGSYDISTTPIVAKRAKIVTTTRVSDELRWADEDNQLEIVTNIIADQAAALGRALDYIVYHAVNPKTGGALSGYTALTAGANTVTATDDLVADIDSLTDALIDYDINGFALSRKLASDLRKLRIPATGMRLYPEIPLSLNVGNFDGIPAAASGTVNGRLATTPTKVLGIMGDFSCIKWGMVRDITSEIIEYGDPDNTGNDLKGYNQVAYRTEAVLAYAVLDEDAFSVLKSAA